MPVSTRVSKKLVPALQGIEGAILMVNVIDPQYSTIALIQSAISDIPNFVVVNKCDVVDSYRIREVQGKLNRRALVLTSVTEGRGIEEIKYRLSKLPKGKIAVLGNCNSGKTSLINLLTGENNKVGDIPGTTQEVTPHNYDNHILLDTIGPIVDISEPLMVSIDISECKTVSDKLRRCLEEESKGILETIEYALPNLEIAAHMIKKAVGDGGKVIAVGAGASALVAMAYAGQAQETGIPVQVFTNNFASAQPISFAKGFAEGERSLAKYIALALNPDDIVIGVSASGGTGFVYETLRIALEKGVKTIAITENIDTPLGKAATVCIKSNGKPEGPSSSKVMVAHIAIVHALNITVADMRGIDAAKSIEYMLFDEVDNKKMGVK